MFSFYRLSLILILTFVLNHVDCNLNLLRDQMPEFEQRINESPELKQVNMYDYFK